MSLSRELNVAQLTTQGRQQALDDMSSLLVSGKLSDVVLCLGGGDSDTCARFKCHKSILAARSPVFASMFRSSSSCEITQKVDITDVTSAEVMREFLRYLYSGKCDAIDRIAVQLLPLAHKVHSFACFSNLLTFNFCVASL